MRSGCCRGLSAAAPSHGSEFTLERHDSGVRIFSLSRPRANALGRNLLGQLSEAISKVAGDKDARCVVLRSTVTGVFCAGADLKERKEMAPSEVDAFVTFLRAQLERGRSDKPKSDAGGASLLRGIPRRDIQQPRRAPRADHRCVRLSTATIIATQAQSLCPAWPGCAYDGVGSSQRPGSLAEILQVRRSAVLRGHAFACSCAGWRGAGRRSRAGAMLRPAHCWQRRASDARAA
eukprot:COSAG01_NODE_1014_length_12131_cov_10.088749_7_plen_234_part_00